MRVAKICDKKMCTPHAEIAQNIDSVDTIYKER